MPWPKGRARKPKPDAAAQVTVDEAAQPKKDAKPRWTSKAGSNWDDKANSFAERIKEKAKGVTWSDTSEENRLSIDPEILEGLRMQGVVLQWVTKSVYGQEQNHHMSHFLRGGWDFVKPGDIPGIDVTEIDGNTVLMARSLSLHNKALKHNKEAAARPWENRKQYLTEGVPLMSGAGRHPTAVRSNKLNRTLERMDVPEE